MGGGDGQGADALWAQGVLELLAGRKQGLPAAGLGTFEASLAAGGSADGAAADGERCCYVGTLRMHHGRLREAAESFEAAIAANSADRLPHVELVLLLEGQRRFEEARAVVQRAVAAGGHWADPWQRPPLFVQGLRSRPFWDPAEFPWVAELEAAYPEIRAELDALQRDELFIRVGDGGRAEQDGMIVAPGGEWRELVLFGAEGQGEPEGPAAPLPRTSALLERLLPGAVAMAGLGAGEIILSALHPGSRLLPHCASSNNRLTCHLGLLCPEGPRLRVGPEWATWEAGRCLIFDDSYEHEVVHDGDAVRIVLLVRFWHPDLPEERWMPTLETGMGEFEVMQRRRSLPPLSPAAARCLEARRQAGGAGPGGGAAAPAGPAAKPAPVPVPAPAPAPAPSAAGALQAAVEADNDLE